jgi:hypothetical protein
MESFPAQGLSYRSDASLQRMLRLDHGRSQGTIT